MNATRTAAPAQKIGAPALTAAPTALLQRQCACGAHAGGGECDECKKKKGLLARKASGGGALAVQQDEVADALASPGQPLDRDTRAFMESRFQHDFSGVRVHTDARAAGSARALQARAWTLGRDVAFSTGAYAPGTTAGRRLLAHELAHVVQQDRAARPSPDAALEVSEPGDASEREADAAAARVAEGTPVAVRTHAEPDVIHRDDDDTWKYVVGGLAGAAAIGFFIWLASRKGAEDIDNPPVCGPRQDEKTRPAIAGALQWAKTALDRVRAFRAKPAEAAHAFVRDAFMRRFRSADAPVAEKVERVINLVHAAIGKLGTPEMPIVCHTAKTDPSCKVFAAFVTSQRKGMTFCADFFKQDDVNNKVAVIHELTHTLVGGANIDDRAYKGERLFGGGAEPTRLTTEAALTNAESYAEFVADLGSGAIFGEAPVKDVLDCPDDWKPLVQDAVAQAHRAATNIIGEINAVNGATVWQARWTAQRIAGTAPSHAEAKKAYEDIDARLAFSIRVVCNADARDTCREGDIEWNEVPPPSLTLCASWKTKDDPTRTRAVLSGVLGGAAKVQNATWRTGLAAIAADTLTSARFGPPKREDVFGNPAWTPDLLRIHFMGQVPRGTKGSYEESGTVHDRFSNDVPAYTQSDCTKAELPLQFMATFFVDRADRPRPGPYTPLRVSLKYSYPQGGKTTEGLDADPAATPREAGVPLKTTLRFPVKITTDTNGTFVVDLQLDDPDSHTARRYHDEVKVEPVVPCPDAATQPSGTPSTPETQPSTPPAQQTPAPTEAPAPPPTEVAPTPEPRDPIRVDRSPESDVALGVGLGVAGAAGVGVIIAAAAGAFSSKKKAPKAQDAKKPAGEKPKPETAAAPLPKISFQEAMEEGTRVLRPGFGTACGLSKGPDPTDGYDSRDWEEQPERGLKGLALRAKTTSAWVAVDNMIRNIDKDVPRASGGQTRWKFDCFEGVHVLRLYAYWRTMSQAEFDKRFPTVEIGFESTFNREWQAATLADRPGGKPFTEGPPSPEPDARGEMNFKPTRIPVQKSWKALLDEAPPGSQVIWTNEDARRKCAKDNALDFCDFISENATKLGPDRYWAHPFGVVSEQEVKDKMSEAVIGRVSKQYIAQNIYISALRHPKEPPVMV
jgi:Domain of unknown function (DUF4157)/Lysine-specific metallo-endopeptidase